MGVIMILLAQICKRGVEIQTENELTVLLAYTFNDDAVVTASNYISGNQC